MTVVMMRMIGASVLRYGLAPEEGIDALVERLNAFADDDRSLVTLRRLVQV
jgi:hypothetical protein